MSYSWRERPTMRGEMGDVFLRESEGDQDIPLSFFRLKTLQVLNHSLPSLLVR